MRIIYEFAGWNNGKLMTHGATELAKSVKSITTVHSTVTP